MTGERVLSLKNDFLFKVVYGSDTEESKFILIALLNKILGRNEDPITDIVYKNPFQKGKYPDEKETVLDIKAVTDSGILLDVEMQLLWEKDLVERFIIYHGGLIRESLHRGEPYGSMKRTITIGIMAETLLPDEEDFLNEFYLMNRKSHALFSDKTYICCIELPKVNRDRRPIEELTPLEICLEYLKYADENGSEYVDALIRQGGKELEMAQKILKKATQEEILREKAMAREKYINDQISARYREETAYEDGKKEGRDEGRSEIIKTMAAGGRSSEEIANLTGLTKAQVEDLLKA